jgi:hypothetical protein
MRVVRVTGLAVIALCLVYNPRVRDDAWLAIEEGECTMAMAR